MGNRLPDSGHIQVVVRREKAVGIQRLGGSFGRRAPTQRCLCRKVKVSDGETERARPGAGQKAEVRLARNSSHTNHSVRLREIRLQRRPSRSSKVVLELTTQAQGKACKLNRCRIERLTSR